MKNVAELALIERLFVLKNGKQRTWSKKRVKKNLHSAAEKIFCAAAAPNACVFSLFDVNVCV